MAESVPQPDWIQPPLLPVLKGKRLGLSLPRRLVIDLMHFAKKVPSIPVQRRMRLASLVAARRAAQARPKWALLMAKAFAMVAAEMPKLRQAYMAFPWPHLYEHPESIATIAIEREYQGEEAVFFPKFFAPDRQPLNILDAHMRFFKNGPLEQVHEFRMGMSVSRLWRPLRRMLWWYALNVFGDVRARAFGTYGVSTYAGLGAESLHPISPTTFLLNFGTIADNGQVDVRLIYDHRVLDGAVVARALGRIEEVLNDQIAGEVISSVDNDGPRTNGQAA